MRSRCMFCERKIGKKSTICFACKDAGPYNEDNPEAAAYACQGVNYKGKPCQQWAKVGKPHCTYHKSQFKEESE